MKTVRVGIIGAGLMGKIHARAYARTPGAQVAAIADRHLDRAQALAGEVGGQAGTDIEAVLHDPSIDLVDVALPTPEHAPVGIAALDAGKHLVVEKPLAATLSDADALIAAARRAGKFLMVAQVLRFWPEYMAIQAALQSGRLGRPLFATSQRVASMPDYAIWFRNPQISGGAVLDLQIHEIDLLNWLFGKPRRVAARGRRDETGGWNHVGALFDYAGVSAFVETSFMMPAGYPFTAGLRVLCERGVLEYQFRAGGSGVLDAPAASLRIYEPADAGGQCLPVESGDAFEREIAYFVACVQCATAPAIITPADARLAVQVALATRQSLETGESVSILAGA